MSEQNQNPIGAPQEPQQLPPAQPAGQTYLPPPNMQPTTNYTPVAAQTTNIWAVVSLVSSVLSWLGCLASAALSASLPALWRAMRLPPAVARRVVTGWHSPASSLAASMCC